MDDDAQADTWQTEAESDHVTADRAVALVEARHRLLERRADDDDDAEPDDDADEYDPEDGPYGDDDDDDLIDGVGFADPGGDSALRAATPWNPRNLPCPTCGGENLLTPADVAHHYQCDGCARQAEGYGP